MDFILAVFLCLLSFPGGLFAQSGVEDYIVINRLSRENGLPDQDVNGIYFDSKGFAWISTFGGGLVRYDGDSFIRFSTKTDPAFRSDFVNQCGEDDYGRLWVPCAGILNIIDMRSLTLIDELPGMSRAWRQTHSPVNLNRDAQGRIWFTAEDMLYRVAFSDDGARVQIDSVQCKVSNVNLMPNPCDVDGDGSVWVAINGRLHKVRYIEERGLCMSEILPGVDIGEDNKSTALLRAGNDVWIGTGKGLYRVNLATGNHLCYLHSDEDNKSIPNNDITGLCTTPDGEIAIGTLGGVCIYNANDQSFSVYGSRLNAYGNRLLPGEMVRTLTTRGNQLWVGLEAEGLAIIQKKPLQIINLSRIETTSTPIPTTPIRSLFIDSNDVLWLAATEYGLCRQVGGLVFQNYSTDKSVTTFCEDRQGRIWTGSVTGRLHYISPASPDVIRVPEGSMSETAKTIDVILQIAYDEINEYIWISAHNGLYYYDLRNYTYNKYPVKTSASFGMCITPDKLWVSGIEGLNIIDLKTLGCRLLAGIPSCLALAPDGDTLWAGTYGAGLFRIDHCLSEEPVKTVFSEKDGLADTQIQGLLLDGINLWIATENGLSCLDTQAGEIASFGIKDGLKSMAFCENSMAKGKSGTIYLGQKEGLSILRSGYVRNNYANKPDISITGYYTADQYHTLSDPDIINKDEKDNDFILKFSDLSYSRRSDITYESRVLPTDKSWSPIFSNSTYVRFGHIPGGRHQIQIRAVDEEGNVLSQDEKVLSVTPVLLRRWWFRLLAILFLGFMTYLFVLWNTKSISKKKDQLQKEVDRQTKVLKEQKEELERKAEELSEQNALLQRQNEMIASHNTLLSGTLSNRETEFQTQLLEAIQKKYKDPDLDVHTLAESMGMSRSLLNEKIQNTLGLSIAQFIRTYRLNVAKEMIGNGTNTDMNISEIAYEVGFNDPKYFTRCFTKEFGATPSDLQKKNNDAE
ncbi:MAG: helix-turn-helix domain-containing protein [Bacteroidales bacterium]|nr:helix-turn-helix domain-containing protein [Bacteroidales bacterium]